jgi:hypothetical protein
MNDEDVDLCLRRALMPTPDAAARVATAALAGPRSGAQNERFPARIAVLATTVVLVVLAILLWPAPPAAVCTASVYSVGDLVVGVSPCGTNWIVGPGSEGGPSVPMIIVVKGANP